MKMISAKYSLVQASRFLVICAFTTSWVALPVAAVSVSQPALYDASCLFGRTLQIGSVGEDVMRLQKILNTNPQTAVAASGPGSAGKETLRFGAATRAAVINFQNMYSADVLAPSGMDRGNGVVGPLTRTKLQSVCVQALSYSTSTPVSDQRIQENISNSSSTLIASSSTEASIATSSISSASTTLDSVQAPFITYVAPSFNAVGVNWRASTGAVSYTILRKHGNEAYITLASGITANSYFDATARGNGTPYYYMIQAVSRTGAIATSSEVAAYPSFGGGSSLVADVTPPVISAIVATPSFGTASITWTTDEPATSQVEYGDFILYSSTTTLDSTLVTSHTVNITGLNLSTIYHYRIITKDAQGNTATSTDRTFLTGGLSEA